MPSRLNSVVRSLQEQAAERCGDCSALPPSSALSVLVGWEAVNHPMDGELVAFATTFFRGHDRMIGGHTLA
jgi:hypothetical protein